MGITIGLLQRRRPFSRHTAFLSSTDRYQADLSPWAPYLRLLPTPSEMEAYHPLFFDNATIASFEGSDVQAPLRERRDSEVARFTTKFAAEGSVGRELQVP